MLSLNNFHTHKHTHTSDKNISIFETIKTCKKSLRAQLNNNNNYSTINQSINQTNKQKQ